MLENKNYIAIPPGETIKELLQDRGIKQKEFADRMGMSEKHISHLVNGKVHLTYDVALKLENVFGVPASFWNNLEATYREKIAKIDDENNIEEEKKIASNLPYSHAANLGWLPKTRSIKQKVKELRTFFSVSSLKNINNLSEYSIAYRKLNRTTKSEKATLMWLQQAINIATKSEITSLNIPELKNQIHNIKKLSISTNDESLKKLQDILYDCGVLFVALPSFPSGYLQGLAFRYGKRTILAVSDRNKRADIFWFTLFHELSHIILEHLEFEEDISEEMEKEIDEYAQNLLINPEAYAEFLNTNHINEETIQAFSNDNAIHPGIVIGRLENDKIIDHSEYHYLKDSIDFENITLHAI